jgi:hypothetical protein
MGTTALLPLRRKCAMWISITHKNPLPSVGPEPAPESPVGAAASTLTTRPPRAAPHHAIISEVAQRLELFTHVLTSAVLLQVPWPSRSFLCSLYSPRKRVSGVRVPGHGCSKSCAVTSCARTYGTDGVSDRVESAWSSASRNTGSHAGKLQSLT